MRTAAERTAFLNEPLTAAELVTVRANADAARTIFRVTGTAADMLDQCSTRGSLFRVFDYMNAAGQDITAEPAELHFGDALAMELYFEFQAEDELANVQATDPS